MAAFEELGLMEHLSIALDEMNWFLPTPVQQDAVVQILGGSDVMCAAETGAGKTGAFCLPIIQLIYEKLNKHVDPKKITAALKHCSLNKDDFDQIQVAENGLNVSASNVKSFGGVRGLYGVNEGRWAYNVTVKKGGAGIKVGWAAEGNIKLDLGTDKNGFAYCGAGTKVSNGHEVQYGEAFKAGDVITCLRDVPNSTISFLKNGKPLGEAFQTPEKFSKMPLFPCVSMRDGQAECYFGLHAAAPPAEGYKWLEEAKGERQEKFYADFIRRRAAQKRGEQHTPSCIILEPTLELCQQVVDELHKFVKYIDSPRITISSIFGRRQTNEIVDELQRGVDIIVGTPSRVKQFLEMGPGTLCLTSCDFLVFDEADRLLDSENIQMVKNLYTTIRKTNARRLQMMMFSATLHDPVIQELALQMCPQAVWVDLKGKDFVPDTVHHAIVYADPDDDDRWRQCIIETDGVHEAGHDANSEGPDTAKRMNCQRSHQIKRLKPEILLNVIGAYDMEQCLIFCRTRDDCDHLSSFLNAKGGGGASGKMEKGKENRYSNVALHSGFPPRQRAENLDMFKQGDVRFLICTDVAARGIDIKQLPFVINMMLPDKPEDYIHRIGRTGRADRMGMAISIATSKHREKVWYHSNCNRGMRNGRPCTDTRLVEQGGCCIWYNEPMMIKEIEKRCGEELSELDTNYRYVNADADNAAVEYGQSRQEAKMKKSDNVCFIEQHAAIVNILSAKTQGEHLDFASQLRAIVKPAAQGAAVVTRPAARGRGAGVLPAAFTAARDVGERVAAAAAPAGVKTLSRTRNR